MNGRKESELEIVMMLFARLNGMLRILVSEPKNILGKLRGAAYGVRLVRD